LDQRDGGKTAQRELMVEYFIVLCVPYEREQLEKSGDAER
jgi:hypothetical protein